MRVVIVCLMSLAGCAELSGLDSLGVGDATTPVDAAGNDVITTTDANNTPDADADAGSSSDADAAHPLDAAEAGAPCSVPADCNTGEVCCETFSGGKGQVPNCTYDADTVACASPNACATKIALNCTETDVFRRCVSNTDCTETNYPKCCTGKIGDAGVRTVCLSSQIAQLTGATCL